MAYDWSVRTTYLGIEGRDVVEPVDGLAAGNKVDASILQLLQVHVRTDPAADKIGDQGVILKTPLSVEKCNIIGAMFFQLQFLLNGDKVTHLELLPETHACTYT